MPIRGVRGATVALENTRDAIDSATRELLGEILASNPGLELDDLASVFFTMTDDLNAGFPAFTAREMGWTDVPLLCAKEINVPGGLKKCIRVLLHWNTDLPQREICHVYLGEASGLRPDLTNN